MHEAHYLEFDGRLNFVEVFGTAGRPVLCIHSAGQSGVQYRHAAQDMADRGFRPVVVDMPGHGRSEPARGGPITDLDVYAEWCLDVLERLELDDAYVVGCSIGGTIAMDIATKGSPRIRGVVAMAAADAHAMGPRRKPRPLRLEDIGAPSIRDRTYYGALESAGSLVSPERAEILALMHCREDWHVTFADGSGMGQLVLWDALPTITCPIVIVAGRDDPFSPWRKIVETAARIPHAHLEILDGIAHYPMEELEHFGEKFESWVELIEGDLAP